MRHLKIMILLAVTCLVATLFTGCATPKVKSEVAMSSVGTSTIGDTVRLFHSGSQDIEKVFCVGDVIPVYREVDAIGVTNRTEVGKIKVLSYEGKQSILAQVVEGTVKPGNIAEKEATACMIYVPATE